MSFTDGKRSTKATADVSPYCFVSFVQHSSLTPRLLAQYSLNCPCYVHACMYFHAPKCGFFFLGSLGEVESARGGLLAALQEPLSPAVTLRLTFCLSWCKRCHFWGVKLDRCVLFLATWMTTHEQQYGQMSLFFFLFCLHFESAATTDIDWVELFPPVKLRNICVDLKMSAEPTFTE